MTERVDFVTINAQYTARVVDDIGRAERNSAVLVEAPPGAGKSSLTVSVANALTSHDSKLRLPVVTQTNEQADDLVLLRAVDREGRRAAAVLADRVDHCLDLRRRAAGDQHVIAFFREAAAGCAADAA